MITQRPLVSIIVPVYNGEKYITTCFQNILNQTYKNWELIFVNDGSTDKSSNVLKTVADNDKRCIVITTINQGVSIARDLGIRSAHGDYVVFLDVDDTLEKNSIYTWLTNIENSVDIVHSGFNFIVNKQVKSSQKCPNIIFNKKEYYDQILTGKLGWQLCGKLFRKTLFDDSIIIPRSLKCGEDCAILIQLVSKARKIRSIDQCCYNYHQYNTSVSHIKSNTMGLEMLKARDFIITRLKSINETPYLTKQIQIFELLCFSAAIRKGLCKNDPEAIKSIRRIKLSNLRFLPIKKILNIALFILKYYGSVL